MLKRGSRPWSAKALVWVSVTRTGWSGTKGGPKRGNRLGPVGSGKQVPEEKLRAEVTRNRIKGDTRGDTIGGEGLAWPKKNGWTRGLPPIRWRVVGWAGEQVSAEGPTEDAEGTNYGEEKADPGV
ncbi:hypothetical protein NDU88_010023 [Pleurodeles waltl]|uniref:Uncharacterized protein n=1 Tax=Pleurodeles waltl TaxID=8319 RepID=A0AAV7QZ33_PLEWA|nr:hypothetical protein NDU88_010023 [Pleurodeles waltl]